MPCNGTSHHQDTKSYRRPRRRPAHLRTKTGCLTCRSRKKKCDERGSPCHNCLQRKIECIWPGRRAIDVHDQPGDPESSSIAAESVSGTECKLVDTRTPSIITFSDGPACYSPILSPANSQLFGFLQTTFLPQLIHPVNQGSVNELVTRESLRWAFRSPFCMHALLACAATEIPVNNPQYRRMAELHYLKAVSDLRKALMQTSGSNQWTVVLWTVLILCIYERSKPHHSQGVDVHLAGAAQLIQVYFQKNIPDTSTVATDTWMPRLFLESFMFHVATSIPFQLTSSQSSTIDSAFSLAENILEVLCLPNIFVDSTSPVLGVPPKLFQYIYSIARMYQRYPDGVDVCHYKELEQDLRRWDSLLAGTAAPELLTGPRLYVLCSRILLNRLNPAGNQPDNLVSELVSHAMALVTQLRPAQDYFAEYYSWPFLVLGTCAEEHSDRQIRASGGRLTMAP